MLYRKQLTGFKQKLIKTSGAKASPTPNEGVKSLKFISDGFDYFNSF